MTMLIEDAEAGLRIFKPTNQILAAGECLMISQFTAAYGKMPIYMFAARLEAAAAHDNVHILYDVGEGESPPVAVAYMLVGNLSATIAKLYVARNRELSVAETNSGPQMWIMENCCPFGHFNQFYALMQKAYPSTPKFYGLIEGAAKTFPNKVWDASQGE